MEINVGKIDKILRIVVGVVLLAWALTGGPVWAWIGLLPLITGIFGVCPAYSILGINTCSTK
ncbi:MAG: YgaP family membrane protein [Methylophilus sp.]